jgi:hypothetical protein
MRAEDYGLRVIINDTNHFPEWSFWKKLRIYLSHWRCRCGFGRHHGWPQSPADVMREATKKMAGALSEEMDRQLMKDLKWDD